MIGAEIVKEREQDQVGSHAIARARNDSPQPGGGEVTEQIEVVCTRAVVLAQWPSPQRFLMIRSEVRHG